MHSWFIRSLLQPSIQCISITTSLSSGTTFSRHLNRKCLIAPGLRGLLGSAPCPASVQVDSMSTSSPVICSAACSFEDPPLPMCSACRCGPASSSADAALFSPLPSVGAGVAAGAPEASWGALGSSRSWRVCSRHFCRLWIQVFSTAVRRRLCSCFPQGTRLCRTCYQEDRVLFYKVP